MDFLAYKQFLKTEYPGTCGFLKNHSWEPLFFSESLALSHRTYRKMEKIIKILFQLKKKEDYQKSLSVDVPKTAFKQQSQDSVLMAYDFHINKEGEPQLIEVNTNASSFLMVNSFYQFKNRPYQKAREKLRKSFQTEWEHFKEDKEFEKAVIPIQSEHLGSYRREKTEKLKQDQYKNKENIKIGRVKGFGGLDKQKTQNKNKAPKKVVLIDRDPLSQKMAMEFFMYQDFFRSMNWPFEICDSQSLTTDDEGFLYSQKGEKVDFVYNRSTDFYFEEHPHLAKAYLKGACAISPNPREYYLLSDKDRLCDWSAQKDTRPELKQIKNSLLFSEILNSNNKERIWKDRKKYFFKIRRGYSGKSVYRGASLSHKKFDELYKQTCLVQEFSPPLKIKDSKAQEWKTDFRAYVYKDQIQQLTARCYRGQLTNFREKNSGFALVDIV